MGIFDLFDDLKENMEKSKKAKEYIRRANELVKEGDELYERAYDKVISYASETEYRLYQHMNYKKNLVKELGSNVDETLKEFKKFNIDSKTIDAPSIQESNVGLNCFKAATSSCFESKIYVPSIFDMFISDVDYYEAKSQLDEAKRYKEEMRMERDRLNSYKEKMSEIRSFICSEKNELDSLMRKLKSITEELKSSMQKNSFSMEETEYLKGIHKIAECIVNLLSTEFLNDGFSINQRYKKAFEGVKSINQNLPYAPSISDANTLSAIKIIIDGVIVN